MEWISVPMVPSSLGSGSHVVRHRELGHLHHETGIDSSSNEVVWSPTHTNIYRVFNTNIPTSLIDDEKLPLGVRATQIVGCISSAEEDLDPAFRKKYSGFMGTWLRFGY